MIRYDIINYIHVRLFATQAEKRNKAEERTQRQRKTDILITQ